MKKDDSHDQHDLSGHDRFGQGQAIREATKQAVRGGASGATAMMVQVLTLMWVRTTMNYQYRYGTSTFQAVMTLWQQGKVRRFYRGLGPALVHAPLCRFGDTAANAGVFALLEVTFYVTILNRWTLI